MLRVLTAEISRQHLTAGRTRSRIWYPFPFGLSSFQLLVSSASVVGPKQMINDRARQVKRLTVQQTMTREMRNNS